MENDIGPAAANAVAAGRNFWANLTGMLESNTQKKRLQQEGDLAKQRLSLDVDEQALRKRMVDQQIAQADLNNRHALKQDFLQTHDPVAPAKASFGQRAAGAFMGQVKPVSNADVASQNEAMLGKDLAHQLYPNPQAAPGNVQFPMPSSPEQRAMLGIPESIQQDTWSMPQTQFDSIKDQFTQHLVGQANAEFEKPFDEMSKEAQEAIIESYQKNAPPGVEVSPAEAAQAYRSQQIHRAPPVSPGQLGLIPTSGEINPLNPESLKLNLTAPIGGAENGTMTPEQYKDFGEPLQKLLSGNEELKLAHQKGLQAQNVVSYADDPHPTVSSDKSLIMSYLKTIDPTVRVSEGTVTTVMDGMGLPEEMKNSINHVMTGSLFTPEHRQWFKSAALQNLENARNAARDSIQSQLSIAGATGNPMAGTVKLPPNVLPPSGGQRGRGPGGMTHSTVNSQSTTGSAGSTEGVKKFSSPEQLKSANLPAGTRILMWDGKRYRPAEVTE